MLRSKSSLGVAIGLALQGAASTPAIAQAPAAGSGLEEVVVTATRREESVQDIPISVTAISAETLDAFGISSTDTVALLTPGLTFGTQVLYAQPYIRGIGSDLTSIGTDTSVAMYVDGVYQARAYLLFQNLNNVERIEVLKGPQGALYGRNATGGAINIVTRRPEAGFTGDIEATGGNDNLLAGKAYLSGGSEQFAASFAGYVRNHDGYYENLTTGNDVEEQDDFGGMVKARWTPNDANELTLSVDASNVEGAIGAFASQFGTDNVLASTVPGACFPSDPHKTCADQEQRVIDNNYQRNRGATARWESEFNPFDLVVVGGWRESKSRSAIDVDASDAPIIWFANQPPRDDGRPGETYEMWSVEPQLISNSDGPFSWLLGGMYLKDEGDLFVTIDVLNTISIQTENHFRGEAFAAYAEGSYAFGSDDRWKATAGVRYADETKETRDTSQFFYLGGFANGTATPPTEYPDQEQSWDDVLGSFSLSYDLGFGNAYARWAQGFKSGAFNLNSPGTVGVDPENIDSYELGIKTTLADGRVQLNAAAFFYDYKDIQVQSIDSASGGSIIQNAATAEVKGFEADMRAQLTDRFQLQAGVSYIDGEYTDFPNATVSVPCSSLGIPAPINCTPGDPTSPAAGVPKPDLSGNTMPYAPEFSGNIAAIYTLPVSFGSFEFSALVSHTGDYFFDPVNRLEQDAYTLVNASASFHSLDDRWSIMLWSNNLTDEEYLSFLDPVQFGDFGHWADPQTYGITLGFSF